MSKKEEALMSLCDLPVIKITKDENESMGDQIRVLEPQEEEEENDFEFGSWRADSLLREPNMCAAEDVFFQGQILPLRLSVCSDSGMAGIRQDSRCVSRSESMDHFYGFTGSRNSSIKSHNSNSSSTGGSVTAIRKSEYTQRPRELEWNHFHAHPSPRPQIWQTTARPGNGGGRTRRSTAWGFFRLGLVRTPEIELQDLKLKLLNRNIKSCESSSSRNSKNRVRRVFDGFSGCKCSVNIVETIASRIAIIKKVSGNGSGREEKQVKQRKQGMAHRRTFEWLKQLSLAVADLPREA
ncbi:uncharacterized protein LOC122661746 [Telopea speciosissima]|uniref:uncharacterized protein LOC122661746 n=1 Tax=Telopea speciosissima TaxID=54955 RepID=UPI001CC63E8D|nr:uncharacterized protein LOC122661746 [Telopea speciosissima]